MSNLFENDFDLINDMFDNIHTDVIENNKDEYYYIGKAENLLKQFTDINNYYIFLTTILKKYNEMETEQQDSIKNLLFKKDVNKELNINKDLNDNKKLNKKSNKKNKKSILNINDDY